MGDHSHSRSHRSSSSRDKHTHPIRKEVPVARPHAPPVVAQAVPASSSKHEHRSHRSSRHKHKHKSKRRSFKFISTLRKLRGVFLVLLMIGCMGAGWFGIQALFNGAKGGQGRKDSGQAVAMADTSKNQPAPPTGAKIDPTVPPPPPKIDPTVPPPPPKVDPPKVDAPKTDVPKTDPPKTDPPKTDPPKTDPPKTDPPKTEPKTAPAGDTPVVYFNPDIKKLVESKCNRCHGDGKNKPGGKLDTRSVASIVKGGSSGAGVVPGDPKKSPFYVEVEEGTMPPKGEGKISDEEKKLIFNWIKSGAKESGAAAGGPAPMPAGGATLAYEKHVAPILQAKCAKCHDGVETKGGFSVATLASIKKGGKNGPAVVAGNLAKSELWSKVDPDLMPPEGSPALTPAEKDTLKKWIETGAKDNKEAMVTRADRDLLGQIVAAVYRR